MRTYFMALFFSFFARYQVGEEGEEEEGMGKGSGGGTFSHKEGISL